MKAAEIDRNQPKQDLIEKYKQRDMEQNMHIQQLSDHVHELEQQLQSLRFSSQLLSDDEKASQQSTASADDPLPQLLPASTITIKERAFSTFSQLARDPSTDNDSNYHESDHLPPINFIPSRLRSISSAKSPKSRPFRYYKFIIPIDDIYIYTRCKPSNVVCYIAIIHSFIHII